MSPLPMQRRAMLSGLAMLAFGRPGFAADAAALAPLPDGQPIDQARFMALSGWLTGRQALDATTGKALLAALQQAGYGDKLAALCRGAPGLTIDPAQGGSGAAQALQAAGLWDAAHAVLRGWYVGLVTPPHGGDILVAYETTLIADLVGDMLALRSYCAGPPHFWAKPPLLADIPLAAGNHA